MNYSERYNFWCNANLPEDAKSELAAIANNEEELKSRFGSDLQFGTAGMRGIMGMGSNRLNRYTVRRAAQGMAAWLSGTDLPQIAAIAYDSRHNSKLFAEVWNSYMAVRPSCAHPNALLCSTGAGMRLRYCYLCQS